MPGCVDLWEFVCNMIRFGFSKITLVHSDWKAARGAACSLDSAEKLLQRPISAFSTISPLPAGAQGLNKDLGQATDPLGQKSLEVEDGSNSTENVVGLLPDSQLPS